MDEAKRRELAEKYIPSPRDETLDEDEYYVLSVNGVVQKGWISDIAADRYGNELYRLRNSKGIVRSWDSDSLGYTQKMNLYDNKKDCKAETHYCYNDWEELRNV